MTKYDIGRLLISCPDRLGIVHAVSRFLSEQGANIIHSDQHSTAPEGGSFFMRIEFQLDQLDEKIHALQTQFQSIAQDFSMVWKIALAEQKKRVAIFVTKEDHCLQELLWRWQIGELDAEVVMIVSNHPDLEPVAAAHGIPYHHIPTTAETRETSAEVQLKRLVDAKVDLVILARYMQIIPQKMIDVFPNQMINIHHSFLPAFVGANPYGRAYDRGVKIIGATAHYVTEELDQGPIIEQDVQRVSHRHHADDLKRIGRDVERMVLAKAVQWHLNDQVWVDGNKTIVFPG